MSIRELVDCLSDAYVTYELLARRIDLSRDTLSIKKEKIIGILDEENWNTDSVFEIESHLEPTEDLAECRTLMIELTSLLMSDKTWNGQLDMQLMSA